MEHDDHKWHLYPWQVRYQECDQMGVVYHANYLNWFEIGRTEWIRAHGWSYKQLEAQGFLLPLVDVNMRFIRPARYDDTVLIGTRLVRADRLQVEFASEVRLQSEQGEQKHILVSGKTKHVWLNRDWKPVRLDRALPELYHDLQKYSEDKG